MSGIDEIDDKDMSLAFSEAKQQAVLGHALTNDQFFNLVRDRVKDAWFQQSRVKELWRIAMAIGKQYDRRPTIDEVANSQQILAMDLKDQEAIHRVLGTSVMQTEVLGLDLIGSEMTDWLRSQVFMKKMKNAETTFNAAIKAADSGKFKETYDGVRNMVREIEDISFEHGLVEDFSNPIADITNQMSLSEGALSFGNPNVDSLLLPEGKGKGSLLKGDMTILLAPTNIGKTTCMITVTCHNLKNGKSVLFIPHEGRVGDLKMKIWQCMLGCTRQYMMDNLSNPEFRARLEAVKAIVSERLVLVPMFKGGLTVEEVQATVRRLQEDRKVRTGQGFDLMVNDYAAKLTTEQAKGGQYSHRQVQEVVYNRFTSMALENDIHVLTAIQTNREGSKVNKKITRAGEEGDNRLLSMEDVMESWGPMTTATNVISINRDAQAQAKGYVTYHICKSRSSEVGWAVVCRSEYATARTHGPDLESTFYRGHMTMNEKIEVLLKSGGEVTDEKFAEIEGQRVTNVRVN